MKIQIEATEMITTMNGAPCRLWKGVTEGGVECLVFVHRIAVHKDHDQTQFDHELLKQLPPGHVVPLSAIL